MGDVNQDILHEILEGEYKGSSTFSTANKTVDMQNFKKMKTAYAACMNQDAMKRIAVKPVRDLLDELDQYYPESPAANGKNSSKEELTKALVWLSKNSVPSLVSFGVTVSFLRYLMRLMCLSDACSSKARRQKP